MPRNRTRSIAPGKSAGKGSIRGQTMSGRLGDAARSQMKQQPAAGPGLTKQVQPGPPRDTSLRPKTTEIPVVSRTLYRKPR